MDQLGYGWMLIQRRLTSLSGEPKRPVSEPGAVAKNAGPMRDHREPVRVAFSVSSVANRWGQP